MNCPYCNHDDTCVLESRSLLEVDGIRRRRECKKCKKRFTTHERMVKIDLRVVKKSGEVEHYDRDKLVKGVKKACYKRMVTNEQVEDLVDEIELKLLGGETVEIRSREIGKMVLGKLREIDELAYLRFASVYMDFRNADEFKKFISRT